MKDMRELIVQSTIHAFDEAPTAQVSTWDAIDGLLYGTGLGCALSLAVFMMGFWFGGLLQ